MTLLIRAMTLALLAPLSSPTFSVRDEHQAEMLAMPACWLAPVVASNLEHPDLETRVRCQWIVDAVLCEHCKGLSKCPRPDWCWSCKPGASDPAAVVRCKPCQGSGRRLHEEPDPHRYRWPDPHEFGGWQDDGEWIQ